MSVLTQFVGGGIKSIQRGVSGSVNAGSTEAITITSVDTSKSILMNLGVRVTNSGSPEYGSQGYFTLTNSTTITFTNGSHGQPCAGSWQIVEYY
jgi:hypothetical protein